MTDRSHARRRRLSFAARFIASVSRLLVSATSSPRRARRRHDARDVRPHDDTTRRAPFIFVTLTRSSRRPASRTRSTRPTNFPPDALASPRLVASPWIATLSAHSRTSPCAPRRHLSHTPASRRSRRTPAALPVVLRREASPSSRDSPSGTPSASPPTCAPTTSRNPRDRASISRVWSVSSSRGRIRTRARRRARLYRVRWRCRCRTGTGRRSSRTWGRMSSSARERAGETGVAR